MAELFRPPLAFGLAESVCPVGVTSVWGARWIWPNSVVWDRQDIWPRSDNGLSPREYQKMLEDRDRLTEWLSNYALENARTTARELSQTVMTQRSTERFTLYEDRRGVIYGNPQGSHGYVYVTGFLWPPGYER